MKAKKLFKSIGVNAIAWVLSILLITPLVLILINSLKDSQSAAEMSLRLPTTIQWENFKTVIERGKLGTTFLNSLMYSAFSVGLCTLTSAMAASTAIPAVSAGRSTGNVRDF